MKKVTVLKDLLDVLPYSELSWEKFQTLCNDVLYNKYNIYESREYLNQGDDQQGIDTYAYEYNSEEKIVAQCKREKYIGPQDIDDILNEFIDTEIAKETKEFILCTSYDLSRLRDEEGTIRKARERLSNEGINLIIWDERGLSTLLKNSPTVESINIVYRYFGEEIALQFYGELWNEYVKKLRTVPKNVYERPLDYIPRTVINHGQYSYSKRRVYWDIPDENGEELVDLFKSKKDNAGDKVILLSTAGYGKSEELKIVASHFCDENLLLHPIKFLLRDYNGQEVSDLLNAYRDDWRNIPEQNILLIFDGLDEINDTHFTKFLNSLNGFLELHPKVNSLVSSRFNFYDLTKQPLRNFDVYILNPISNREIENYIDNKTGGKSEDFRETMRVKGFNEYIDNPYYLTRLIKFYNDASVEFPNNKTELFEKILFEQISEDDNKRNGETSLRDELLPDVQKVAFIMTYMGKSTLTDAEIESLMPDSEKRKQLKLFCILNRNSSENGSWSFEHKNLQEYLCATFLSNYNFEELHPLISFHFDDKKLVPKFLNTISFLFETIDKGSGLFSDIFNWISTNEPELLIRFEKEQLSKSTRVEIFKKIFYKYKEKGLGLRVSSNFSLEELAYFVDVDDEVLDFLQSELLSNIDSGLASDSIWIISFCRKPFLYEKRIKEILLSVIKNNRYKHYVHASCIGAFYDLKIVDESTFREILDSGIDISDYKIRRQLIVYLYHSDFYENYVELILSSIEIYRQTKDALFAEDTLKLLMLKFDSSHAIKKLLQKCISDKELAAIHPRRSKIHFELEEVKVIMAKALVAYENDASVLRVVYRFFHQMQNLSVNEKWLSTFKDFFSKTCGNVIVFNKLYKFHGRSGELMHFANEECCDFLVAEYVDKKISEKDMTYMRNSLSWIDRDLAYDYFNPKLNSVSNNAFLVVFDDIDYVQLENEYKTKNQDFLVERDLFLAEVEDIFNSVGKDTITRDELWFRDKPELRKYQYSLALETIRDFRLEKKDNYVGKEEFVSYYSDNSVWRGFVIDTVVDLLKDENKPVIDSQLIKEVENYCIENIEKLDFSNCIKDTSDTSWSYNTIVEYTKEILLLLRIQLEDKDLIKMLPSYYEGNYDENRNTIGKYIVDNIQDKGLLKIAVLSNIKNGNLARNVLLSHYKICVSEGYKEALALLYKTIIEDDRIKGYDKIKLAENYLELGGEITDFDNYLEVPHKNEHEYHSWNWFLIEKMKDIQQEKIISIVRSVLNDTEQSEENKNKACRHLLYLGELDGLKYWVDYIITNHKMLFEHRFEFIFKNIVDMPAKESIDILISLLDYVYAKDIGHLLKFPDSVEDPVYGCLITLASRDYKTFEYIKSELSKLTGKGYSSDRVYSIKYNIENLTTRVYENTSQEVSLSEAFSKYQALTQTV